MTAVAVRTGNEKHARADDHFRLNGEHPLERLLRERGACAGHPYPEWWLDIGTHNRAGNREAKRICREECPVFAECEQVTDHVEQSAPGFPNSRSQYLAEGMTTCVRAGLGPSQRYERRRAERRKGKEGA